MFKTGGTVLGRVGSACLRLAQRRPIAASIPHFRRVRSLMTPEQRLLRPALVGAVGPKPLIFVHVNLSRLVEHPGDDPRYQSHWRRVCRRWVDFVLCSPTTIQPLLAIKLGQRKTPHGVDVLDDALMSAELPLLRLPVADHYDVPELKARIRWALARHEHETDSALYATEEVQTPSVVVNFAHEQLPTFVRWGAGLNRYLRLRGAR